MNLIPSFSRLSLVRTVCTSSFLNFKATPCLFAEPLKKKKRLDPSIVKAREDRKKKRIEKQIRRLERNAKQLKPLEELDVPIELIDEIQKKSYERSVSALSPDGMKQRILLEKKWANYKRMQHLADIKMLDRIVFAQQRALDELRKESEELYQQAIQVDLSLLPFKSDGPVETPPKKDYEAPDGDYVDTSRVW